MILNKITELLEKRFFSVVYVKSIKYTENYTHYIFILDAYFNIEVTYDHNYNEISLVVVECAVTIPIMKALIKTCEEFNGDKND